MNTKIISSLLLVSSFWFLVSPVKALTVDLKAKTLTQTLWSDNLTQALNPGDKFKVQLSIKNGTTAPETQIQVQSKLTKAIDLNEYGVFRIVDIEPGEEYVRVFTATVKDKTQITKNELSFSAKAQNGVTGEDTVSFDINVPTATIAATATPTAVATAAATATKSATKSVLPKTGPADVAFGTIVAALIAIIAYNLRALVRGY